MKTQSIFAVLAGLSLLAFASVSLADDITATGSGNWSSTVPNAPWPGGIVPSTNDDIDVESPYVVTVDTDQSIQYMYGSGTVTLAPGKTLTVVGDDVGAYGAQTLDNLNATANGCTVVYAGNSFWAKRTDYFNLVMNNATTNAYDFYNGIIPGYDATPMHIKGDMTLYGKVKVQEGADIAVDGNFFISTNSSWDCSSFNLTVGSNTTMNGLLLDLDGALGSNYFKGDLTVSASAIGWNISDVVQWGLGGSLTNNGTIVGKGFGSITFLGNGKIAGTKSIKIPTFTINGTYLIANTITSVTNTPTFNGTVVFDLINTNQIVLLTNAGTALFYSGNLTVINSGTTPVSGASYKLFNAPAIFGYGGAFAATSFPSLPNGLSWVDNTLTTGSIDVTGSLIGSPVLTITRNGGNLVLSWDSTSFPGYRVVGQTNNHAGLSTTWSPTGSGTVSPFTIGLNPTNTSVFFRLSNP